MARRFGAGLLRKLPAVPEPTLPGRMTLTFLFLAFWGAYALHNNPVLFAISTVLATVLASVLATRLATANLAIERRLPARVRAGEPFVVRLRVRNRARFLPALMVGFRDALQTDDPGAVTCGPLLPYLAPGGEAEVTYTKRIHRRGVYTITNSLVATRFPFGLFEQRRLVRSPAKIVVLPAYGRLRRGARRQLAARASRALSLRLAREGLEEFHSLREFRAGDNPRHIHWRTSARAGELVRRVFRAETGQDLVVLLDLCVEGPAAVLRRRHLERAVSCAATLLAHAAQTGRRASVHTPDGVAAHRGGREELVPALERLAAVEGGAAPPAAWIEKAPLRAGSTAVLLSLHGGAKAARRVAARRGVRLVVWDVSHPEFGRIFSK